MTQRGNIVRRPDKWRENEPVSASKLEELRDGLDRLIEGTDPRQLSETLPAAAQVFQGELVSVSADHIIVREYRIYPSPTPPVVGSTSILVAKPYLLRRTPFDGQTRDGVSYTYVTDQQRTATIGPDQRTEHVTPGYVVGDLVYCLRAVLNGTGVESGGAIIGALELAGGRTWAADPPP